MGKTITTYLIDGDPKRNSIWKDVGSLMADMKYYL